MAKSVLYICGGRSFQSKSPGRKIYSVVKVWRDMGVSVDHLSGGDILPQADAFAPTYGASAHHKNWVRQVRGIGFLVHSISELRDWLHDRKLYKEAEKRAQASKPNLIWERSSRLHCSGLLLARSLQVPYVLEWKDNLLTYGFSLFKWYAGIIESKKIKLASHIVVESEVLRNRLVKDYDISQAKVIVAHNAVDAGEFQLNPEERARVRKSISVSEEEFLVGYLGSYAFYHDSVRLVRAANCLSDKNIKFVMVGDGKEYEDTYSEAVSLGLVDKQITFLPPVKKEEVPSVLSALDVAVLPGSTDIICPIKVQEYLAMGLPAVLPDYACNREVVEQDISGILFKPFDEKSLARALNELANNREKCREIGSNGKDRMIEKFSWRSTWGRALEVVLSKNSQ